MSSAESDDFLVIEAIGISFLTLSDVDYLPHSVEDEPKVILGFTSIRQSTIGSDVVREPVNPARTPRDGWST